MPTVKEMLSAAVLTRSAHRGYLVQVERDGVVKEMGPYSMAPAQEVQTEFLCRGWSAYIIDAETGELI